MPVYVYRFSFGPNKHRNAHANGKNYYFPADNGRNAEETQPSAYVRETVAAAALKASETQLRSQSRAEVSIHAHSRDLRSMITNRLIDRVNTVKNPIASFTTPGINSKVCRKS